MDDTISRHAAIDAICKHGTELERRGITVLSVANHKQATVDLLESLPSAQPEPRWIPCESEPPKERRSYWVCTDTGYQCQCRWTNDIYGIIESDNWGWKIIDIPQYTKVIAYRPLPKPYERSEDGSETD